MHTVRNRVASRPRPPRASTKGKVPRSPASTAPTASGRREPAFLLRHPDPPAFPAHLIVPAPRGVVIASVPWPEASTAQTPPATGKSAKAKPRTAKSRTAKSRTAKSRTATSGVAKGKSASGKNSGGKARRSSPRKASARASTGAAKSVCGKGAAVAAEVVTPPSAEQVPATMTMIDLLDRALAIEPELPPLSPQPNVVVAASPCDVTNVAPLPRSRALAHGPGKGLIEAIGNWLRSTAKALAFWRPARGETALERTRLSRANARQRALQSQFEALEALKAPVHPPRT